ncbi:energy-coupling factor ABC transporter ATP-binding protein [Finegoldia magna]|uniref:Cobalt ABC transporter ATP-binding protein n=1 Tax=Finegoldia magna (strain ATCC 29328 / DSM 20472 / WAL 2508) TaxID=334413 RepID=B0S3C2_FINM2|nr:ABC transporter ATP-binding protein [Finegoldia magna]MDU5186078.1 ABC transporter ATP-binding protein [Finegoldia magna]MDU7032379.1 ABC transporter ATP-binding protein [Finegoldia magna]OXZ40467.1 ABC transporter ATP-binding protein [Finegoldia magna]UEA69796.1 energy-coupling factor ABC transporter ATP-binding protein [Finegoldia magna]BAG08862.1 cobalt ABC transporter ATP-binding protein [Finegoldia magna ATCC 29328]
MIELKNVSFKYELQQEKTIKNLDLYVQQGEFIGIIGKNGSGKTTLCNIIRGIIPDFVQGEISGDIIIDNKNIDDIERGEMAELVGFVFQNPFSQISGIKKTVFEEIAYGLENLGVPREEIKQRVTDVIKLLKIEDLQDKNPNELSGGQSQRVAIASIIVMNPKVLIFDEPTSQLDPLGTEEIFDILKLLKSQNKTIILVEHKIDLIAEYADRVVVMDDGEIIFNGETHEVLSNDKIEESNVSMPIVSKLAYKMNTVKPGFFKKVPITLDECKKELEED